MSGVDVIIVAWNAQATIGLAIQSAIVQPEISEAIVVYNVSSDETATVVPAATKDKPRVVLPSRFGEIFGVDGWDAIADNIAFAPETQADSFVRARLAPSSPEIRRLSSGEPVAGNFARPGKNRAKLCSLKLVIRRSLIDERQISYGESLRSGEDFAFYLHVLGAGAKLHALKSSDFVAIERATSSSDRPCTQDFATMLAFACRFESQTADTRDARRASLLHRAQQEAKLFHWKVLDVRQRKGRLAALMQSITHPAAPPALASAVASDKLYRAPAPAREVRYLLG